MGERWKDVLGHEGDYEVSDLGRVRSVYKVVEKRNGGTYTRVSKVLRSARNADGYLKCALSTVGVLKSYHVHRLVAKAFLGDAPKGYEVDHINGVRDDNRLENLRWMEKIAHLKDSWRRGQMKNSVHYGEKNWKSCYKKETMMEARRLVAEWKEMGSRRGGLKAIGQKLGITPATMKDISRGRAWRWLDGL